MRLISDSAAFRDGRGSEISVRELDTLSKRGLNSTTSTVDDDDSGVGIQSGAKIKKDPFNLLLKFH